MKEFIAKLHEQWKLVKNGIAEQCFRLGQYDAAKRYSECAMFSGDETPDELLDKFTSEQGIEFCMQSHFPTLSQMRRFKGMDLRKHGIYLDAGNVTLRNPERAVLIGRTVATINIDECARHHIVLLRGAKATVIASKWGMAKVDVEKGCQITQLVSDNAMVL